MQAFVKYIDAIAVQRQLLIDVSNALNKLADGQEQVRKESEKTRKMQEKANKAQEESLELQKDMVAENLRFTDGLMEARREIMEITHVTKGMNKSFFQAASSSRA
tara:strand:+ start:382 stop:696 length:315 start_codon:yes stop_codon:yes gene_type:complete